MPFRLMLAILALAAALPAAAQQMPGDRPPESTGERARDAASRPLEDVNVEKREIPDTLRKILDEPYAATGIRTCPQIAAAVTELDQVLGADVDADEETRRSTADKVIDVGGSVLTGFIPFRGVVREVSGANAARRRYQEAIYAGVARRSFLKGMGQAKGCKPPAAPLPLATTGKR